MGYGLKQSEMQCWEKRKSEIYPELLQCGGRLDHRQIPGVQAEPVLCENHWRHHVVASVMES